MPLVPWSDGMKPVRALLLLAVWCDLAAPAALAQGRAGQNPHGPLPQGLDCSACHTSGAWRPLKSPLLFDHGRVSGFALTGQHAAAACARCHLDLRFDQPRAAEDECTACHVDVHQSRLAGPCTRCHTTSTFREVPSVVLHARVGFPLTGAHLQAPCESCHRSDAGGAFAPVSQECQNCHRQDYAAAAAPDHAAAGFPTDCQSCHGTLTWGSGAAFDHAQAAGGFALVGAHAFLRCADCHQPPNLALRFSPSGQDDCVACHDADYQRAHGQQGYPTACASCHTVDRWQGASFDHAQVARGFALLGAHAPLPCLSCHIPPGMALRFTPAGQNDCVACHQSDYTRAHGAQGYPTSCASCHTINAWSGATFDHATVANGFALEGAHAQAPCTDCHVLPGMALKFTRPAGQNDCVACHQGDYTRAHGSQGYPTTCSSCHGVTTWSGASFDHASVANGYALVGAHTALPCTGCHVLPGMALKFTRPTSQDDCIACHQSDYTSAHGSQGYPTTCLSCHSVNTWSGATFDHATVSGGFALVGAHAPLPCTKCHVVPGMALTFPRPAGQNDCVACHQADFAAGHNEPGFPNTCADCHRATTWSDVTFDHAPVFPLTGPHAVSCDRCHNVAGRFLTFTCLTCHLKPATDEHHKEVAGYSYDSSACYACHRNGKSGGEDR
jgi:hypothetical protein